MELIPCPIRMRPPEPVPFPFRGDVINGWLLTPKLLADSESDDDNQKLKKNRRYDENYLCFSMIKLPF